MMSGRTATVTRRLALTRITNHQSPTMKVLVANLGSTSLKWRLFDFSNGQEQMLHKGGLERVSDYPKAIEECLAPLGDAGHITREKDLAVVGVKTVIRKTVSA